MEIRRSKSFTKAYWIFGVLALCILLVIGTVVTGNTSTKHSYPELKASCDMALAGSPTQATLDAWMNANHIVSWQQLEPLDDSLKSTLVSYGISKTVADSAASCTLFDTDVSGSGLSRHVAYGYFLFSADGSLIDSNLHQMNYGF